MDYPAIKDWLLKNFPGLRAFGSLSRKRLKADIRWLRQRLDEPSSFTEPRGSVVAVGFSRSRN